MMMLKSLLQAFQFPLSVAIAFPMSHLAKLNGHVQSPRADCSAAPIDHDGKVNAKDRGMHAQ